MIQSREAFPGGSTVHEAVEEQLDVAPRAVPGATRSFSLSIEQEELRGISRTVAEIHWLLLILIVLYLIFGGVAKESEPAISSSLFFYAALMMACRYANFFGCESRRNIAVDTWAIVAVVSWA